MENRGILERALRRVAIALALSLGVGLLLLLTGWRIPVVSAFLRTGILGLSALAAFSLFEVWPRKAPGSIPRWPLQVAAVGISVPIATVSIYVLSTPGGAPPFWEVPARMDGWAHLTFAGLLIAPWTALAAVVRQKEAFARELNLSFALERSELERQAVDARLHLLQAQVAPHFLFNTLANVQALVEAGSPEASKVLRSLTAYLRAAVPVLRQPTATIERELQLVRPYLELMQMRMPDRLQFGIDVDPSALTLQCPPTTLLTLVENAIRHGIDPGEEGGRIDVRVAEEGPRCLIRVSDTGVGLGGAASGAGSGLASLRERLQMFFGGETELRVSSNHPRGVIAEIEVPARR